MSHGLLYKVSLWKQFAGKGAFQNLFCIGGILFLKFQYLSLHLKHWGKTKGPCSEYSLPDPAGKCLFGRASPQHPWGTPRVKHHHRLTRGGVLHLLALAAARIAFANAKHIYRWENVFLQWLLRLLVCRGTSVLPQRFPICVLILAHPHPQELCCQALSKSLHYLCRPAAPGQLSTAAGRCREPPEHSMWMVSFVSEALKTNRSRIDTLSHLFHYKFWSLPAISGLTTTNKQRFSMMGCSKVPRWDCQVLQARQAAFLSPRLCTAIHLVILANLTSSLPSRLNPHYNIMNVVVFPFYVKKLPISITFSCPRLPLKEGCSKHVLSIQHATYMRFQ